jgi:hypothetical protein
MHTALPAAANIPGALHVQESGNCPVRRAIGILGSAELEVTPGDPTAASELRAH